MAKEKAEKKKPTTIGRIFKWIGVGLLSVLLTAGIIFQAPWKVIALLVVFLLASTVLPKPLRKWFWFSVAAVVICLVIWVFLPDDNEGWRPYTFDEELAALEAKYAISDSENAAVIYNQLLQDFDSNSFYPDFWDYDWDLHGRLMYEPWSSKEYPVLAQWIKEQKDLIGKLIKVSKFEKCRFPIHADPVSVNKYWPRREFPMQGWTNLLICAGNNDFGDGHINGALEKYVAALRVGEHLRQQLSVADRLVGIAREAYAIRKLNRLIVTGDLLEDHLNVVEENLAEITRDESCDLYRTLEYDKLYTKNEWCMAYEINGNGKVRLSRDPTAGLRALRKNYLEEQQLENEQIRDLLRSSAYLTYRQKQLLKANTILSWFYMPSNPRKVAKSIDAGYEKLYALAKPNFTWQSKAGGLSCTSLFSTPIRISYLLWLRNRFAFNSAQSISDWTYYGFRDMYLQIITDQRGSQLLIALKRYKKETGHWPQSLDHVKLLAPAEIFIDAINGNSFIYKLQGDSFKLYSKGKNNIDEDGERYSYDDGSGPDDLLIWPPKGRKIEQENANAE